MTQLDRAAQTVRPRSPLPLILGLIAVAIGVVVVFGSARDDDTPQPAGPLPAPMTGDSAFPVQDDTAPDPADAPGDKATPSDSPSPASRPDSTADSLRPPRDSADSARPPIGDPAALPRPPVTLPRPESGERP